MDDPWGSPWADEIQHDTPIPLPKKQEDLRKENTNNAPVIVEERAHDAWGTEDDEFEEWAPLPVEDGDLGKAMGFNGAEDSWETRHKETKGGLTNGALNGAALPWDLTPTLHTGDIPKLSPGLPSAAPENLRQPSPDPWSTETPNNGSPNGIHGRDQDVEVEGDDKSVLGSSREPATLQRRELTELAVEDSSIADVIEGDAVYDQPVNTPDANGIVEELNEKDIEIDHGSSRPSSSPSDHEETLPESPRTSLEDEPKRPPISRKVSSKVQELVEHFDGLAKSDIEDEGEAAGPSTTSESMDKPDEDLDEGDDFDDDFGDFEEGHSEAGDASEDRPVTPRPRPSSQPLDGATSRTQTPQSLPTESPKPTPIKEFGRVQYISDTPSINKLFPEIQEEQPEKVFIPDVVPHDSFSSVEERKTWYRISRYGTMLKYKTGDDENYVRVNWAQSGIRSETQKIVARWMEEDRMSGRVILGGSGKGSSLFGWNDPNSAPVPLASAFAEKPGKKKVPAQAPIQVEPEVPREWPKGLVRTRSTSKTRSPPKPRRRTSSKSKRNSEEIKAVPPPVASFGWNSQPDPLSQVPIPLAPQLDTILSKPPSPPRQSSVAKAPALSPIFSPTFLTNHTPSSDLHRLGSLIQPTAAPPVLAPAISEVFSLDDDWGEMMSSPINTAPPVILPLPPSLRQKKSQSFSGVFPNSLQLSPTTAAQSSAVQPGSGHRPTASLDKILIHKTGIPAVSRTDAISMDMFDTISTSSPSNQFEQPAPISTATPVTDGSFDPWASADFSFFESPPAPSNSAPPPAKIPRATPSKSTAFKKSPLKAGPTLLSRPAIAKSVALTASAPATASRGHGRSKSEVEQDRVVASIVKGLPNLSYMLRK